MSRRLNRPLAGVSFFRLVILGGCCVLQQLVECSTESDYGPILQGLPPAFIFGTASAAYQVEGAVNEGGRGPTIWDTFSHLEPPKVARGENGDIACDSYHRYEEDADLTKAAGFEGFRMSIAWSRIYPEGEGDEPNAEGVAHYHDVIDALLDRGLEPMITLYHWDLPQALEDKYGGWLNTSIVPAFEAYADTCFKEYGHKVKKWLTINEPWSFIQHGYSSGMHAPGRCSDRTICEEGDSFTEPYIAGHNVLNAHAKAVSTYRTKYKAEQRGIIGITLNCDWAMPLDPDSEEDKATAERFVVHQLAWWADPIYFGDYPQAMRDRIGERLPTFTEEESALLAGSNDFFGLNHYTSWYYTDIPDENPPREGTSPAKAAAAGIVLPETSPGDGWAQDIGAIQTKVDLDGVTNGVVAETGWLTVVPAGFRPLLKWVSARYGRPIIMVTENGIDRAGESHMSIEEALQDGERQTYYQGYIQSMIDAMVEDAVDVRGYYAWSILDNFEWSDGYDPRFGLTYVDYDNGQTRTPKDTSKWFAGLAEARRRHQGRRDPSDCNGASAGGDDGDSQGYGGEADVQVAAGIGQESGASGVHSSGLREDGRRGKAGGILLVAVLVAAVAVSGFSLGKYRGGMGGGTGQRYEGMEGDLELARGVSSKWVLVYLSASFVLGASCSILIFNFW